MRFGRKRVFVPMSKNPKKGVSAFFALARIRARTEEAIDFLVFGFWQDLQDCQD